MTTEQKKEKVLAAIAARGWFTTQCFWDEAIALRDAGLIQIAETFVTGGNRRLVWVRA